MSEFFVIFDLKSPYIPLSTIFFLNKVVIPQDLGFNLFFRVFVIVLVHGAIVILVRRVFVVIIVVRRLFA